MIGEMVGQIAFWSVIAGLVGMGILIDRIIKSRNRGVVRPGVVINWPQAFAAHRTTAPDDLEALFQGGGAAFVPPDDAQTAG